MSISGQNNKSQCKEQCMKCRCIVKERLIDNDDNSETESVHNNNAENFETESVDSDNPEERDFSTVPVPAKLQKLQQGQQGRQGRQGGQGRQGRQERMNGNCDHVSKALANELHGCLLAKIERREKKAPEKLQKSNGCGQGKPEKLTRSGGCR